MKTADHSIERNVKLIAIVGGVLFLTLVGALIVVQHSMSGSQAALADMVVPTQRELSELTGAVGSMFLRQSEMVSARGESLTKLADRTAHEKAVNQSQHNLEDLFSSTGLASHDDFPTQAAKALRSDVDQFLKVDSELYSSVSNFRVLQDQFNQSVAQIDGDLRLLMEASSGVAGVLRLEYVSQLRRINSGLNAGNVDLETVRPAIVGDTRVQLAAIDSLDAAVLRLGVLAGKVGLTASDDAMNSLAANELIQNRDQIHLALTKIEKLIKDTAVAERIAQLRKLAESLARRVGDESDPSSLASLRRRMLAEERHVQQIQRDAALAAGLLNEHTAALRSFSQDVARSARDSAGKTVSRSRLATIVVSVVGVLLSVMAALRVRTSVVALRAQNERLSELSEDLARVNAGLEETVAQRTASLQLVLDSTGDGMLSVDLTGELLPERSRAVTQWFGTAEPGTKLWDYLAAEDESFRDMLWVGFDQLASDFLPFEVSADQAPSRMVRDDRTYAIEYRDVQEDEQLVKILVLIRDITAQIEAERAEKEAQELHALIGNVLRDREGFNQTISECAALIAEVSNSDDTVVINRGLHTIKGNCAIMGFQRVAEYVHDLEGLLIDEERNPTAAELTVLEMTWQNSLRQITEYLDMDRRCIEIEERELIDLADLAKRQGSYDDIITIVESWRNEPTAAPLHRLAAKTRHVAKRMQKDLDITVEHNNLRLPPESLRSFWSTMVHVVRNAVDHGLESHAERVAIGKPENGQLTLATCLSNDTFEVIVTDDGRGIHWENLRKKAKQKGLPCETEDDLVEALFSDGVSTKEVATDISGRGVGLSAVRASCLQSGGSITVKSVPSQGTSFVFRFPWDEINVSAPETADSTQSVPV